MLSSLVLALVMALALSWTPTANAASMLAIDYGTDSFKASLVKPGVPFDVLLTKEGKRKAPAVVTYRGEERFVGSDAQTLVRSSASVLCARLRTADRPMPPRKQATRYPQDTIASVKLLVGQSPSNPQSQLHSSLFPNLFATTARSSPAIRTSKETVSVEEALAYQLVLAKELAEEQAKESVRDVVITVPGWWAEVERKAMLDAAEIAGLRLVGLINDGAAGECIDICPRSELRLRTQQLTSDLIHSRCQLRHGSHVPARAVSPPHLRPRFRLFERHARLAPLRHAPRSALARRNSPAQERD